MNQTISQKKISTDGQIAFIRTGWHSDIVDQARISFTDTLTENGIPGDKIELFDVPGALEIPLQAKLLAMTGKYASIIGCGFVINGGIYRHDFVASSVIDGLMRVMLDTHVPVHSVVLTPHNFHENEQHHEFFYKHFSIKGREAAQACLQMLENVKTIDTVNQVEAA